MTETPVQVSAYGTDEDLLLYKHGTARGWAVPRKAWLTSSLGPRMLAEMLRNVSRDEHPWGTCGANYGIREIGAADPAFERASRIARYSPAFVVVEGDDLLVEHEVPKTFADELRKAVQP